MRQKTALLATVAGTCLAGVIGYSGLARSADHLDSPATTAEPTADINDLYTWMDGTNAVFAMTVFPNAPVAAKFSDATQYVIHTASGAGFGAATSKEDIICTFDAAQKISCWLGTDDYVTGDASATAGLTSKGGKFKVFAGRRADPFFFNLAGFKKAVGTVEGAASTLTFDTAGCPTVPPGTAKALRDQLQNNPADGGAGEDFFKAFNGLAIVVSVDKAAVTKGGPIVATWASTHKAP
jgi:hypothetical protein